MSIKNTLVYSNRQSFFNQSYYYSGERDATGAGQQRVPDVGPDDRAVPGRPPPGPLALAGHSHDRQVQAAMGSIR